MTADEALAAVRDERDGLDIGAEMSVASAERALVPHVTGAEQPGPVELRAAWVVRFSDDWGFAEVHVDDRTGKVLDVVRSL